MRLVRAGELVVVQEDDFTTAYQAAEADALSFTRIQAGAATTAVRDSISSHVLFVYHLAMGVRNYLIEGVSGTGKSSVCKELQRRGYCAINGDNELAYQGDPDTGKPMDGFAHEHHIWHVGKVRTLVANQDEAVTFFCGGSRNFPGFIDLFDDVFVLEVDLDTLNRRLDERTEDEWGGRQTERELILRLHRTKEDIPKNGIVIDATAPIARVVDEILRQSEANEVTVG
jgi:hypothetical protein